MAKSPPDERLVYLTLKNVFLGANANIAKLKTIKAHVQRHEGDKDLKALLREHDISTICVTAQVLLREGIFASTSQAEIRFPEGLNVPPERSADRAVPEAQAAGSKTAAVKGIAKTNQTNLALVAANKAEIIQKEKINQTDMAKEIIKTHQENVALGPANKTEIVQKEKTERTNAPPLPQPENRLSYTSPFSPSYPIHLPLRSQHRLLVKVQDILECACYVFGNVKMGEILEEKGWDSAECVELNEWARMFRRHENKFDVNKLQELEIPFPEFLDSIAQIRHTAVHRLRVPANEIEQFLNKAEILASLLGNKTCVLKLMRLRREVREVIDELGHNKELLGSMLEEKRMEIASQRAELNDLERAAEEEMIRNDKEYQFLAGLSLEQVIDEPETVYCSTNTTEQGSGSEEDEDTETFVECSSD